jgi:tetratricopeptide (TPR) repeat protein
MTATRARAGRTDRARLEHELFGRLGLPAGAGAQDVETAHDEIVQFLDGAPSALSAWADREIAVADEAYALLAAPSVDLAAMTDAPRQQVIPTSAAVDAGTVEAGRARAATNKGPRLGSPVVRLAVAAAVLMGTVAIAVIGYNAGSPSVPGLTGTPAPEVLAGTQVDAARVSDLMQRISANPNDTTSLQALGDIYYGAGDFETAALWMEKVIAVDSANLTARLALGAALFNVGKPDDAEQQWRQVLVTDPNNLEAHYDLGFMYLSRNPPDMANVKAEWNRVIEIAPNSTTAKSVATHLQSLEGSPAPTGAVPSGAASSDSPSASPAASSPVPSSQVPPSGGPSPSAK